MKKKKNDKKKENNRKSKEGKTKQKECEEEKRGDITEAKTSPSQSATAFGHKDIGGVFRKAKGPSINFPSTC